MIRITYVMNGVFYDHLIFKQEYLAVKWRKVLQDRKAEDIRWIEEENIEDNKSKGAHNE